MANGLMNGWGIDISNSPSFKKAAAIASIRTGARVFARYANLASMTLDFEGLTNTMSNRAMREGLLWYPIVAVFKVGDSWINLPAVPGGRGFNAQGNFGDGFAYGKNGRVYHVTFKMPGEDEADFLKRTPGPETPGEYRGYCLRANDACMPLIDTVLYYSEQIADLLGAISGVTPLLHHPINFQCTQRQRASAIKWYKELEANLPFMFTPYETPDNTRASFHAEPVNLLANSDIIKPTVELIDWFDNRCLTEIGIANIGSQVDKKGENLTEDEIHGTDAVTSLIVQNQVDLINQQIDEMHINEEPGLEEFRCIARRYANDTIDDVRSVDQYEREPMADEDTGD